MKKEREFVDKRLIGWRFGTRRFLFFLFFNAQKVDSRILCTVGMDFFRQRTDVREGSKLRIDYPCIINCTH